MSTIIRLVSMAPLFGLTTFLPKLSRVLPGSFGCFISRPRPYAGFAVGTEW